MKNLEFLTTQIGPRLTGSPQMQAASAWTRKRFQDYHLEAHLETTEIAHGWTRGMETAEITSPIQRRIGIHGFGWSKATEGEITGRVIALDLTKASDLAPFKGKLKGAIVMLRKPYDLSQEDPNPENAYDAVIAPQRGVPKPDRLSWRERQQLLKQAAAEGPALVLADSGMAGQPLQHGRRLQSVCSHRGTHSVPDPRRLRPHLSLTASGRGYHESQPAGDFQRQTGARLHYGC